VKNDILFRNINNEYSEEIKIASKYFNIIKHRSECKPNRLIIGRYSVLPYYKEVEDEINYNKSILINDYRDHKYIANFEWYQDVEKYTFKTWDDTNFFSAPEGKYVVKGVTNSCKFHWDTKMFAKNKKQAIEIAHKLSSDSLIGQQKIIYRQYCQLKTFEEGVNKLPFTNEWRFFFYKKKMLSYGYYWSIAEKTDYNIEDECITFAQKIANIISENTNFFVLDIAQAKTGEWKLVEINDGQMSGLSENHPNTLYGNLKKALQEEEKKALYGEEKK